jgi:hypothetical protein
MECEELMTAPTKQSLRRDGAPCRKHFYKYILGNKGLRIGHDVRVIFLSSKLATPALGY